MENQNENSTGPPADNQVLQTQSTAPIKSEKSKKIIYVIASLLFLVAISLVAILFFKSQKSIEEKKVTATSASNTIKQNVSIKVESDLLELQKQKIIYNDDSCKAYLSNFDSTEKSELPIDTKYPFCGVAPNGNYYYYFNATNEKAREFCFHGIVDKTSKNDYCVEKSTNTDSATEQFFDIKWSSDGKFIIWRKNPDDAGFTMVDVTNPNVNPYFNDNNDCYAYSWFPISNRLFCFGAGKFKIIDPEKYVGTGGKEGVSELPMPESGMKKINTAILSKESPDVNLKSLPCAHIAISEDEDKIACNQSRSLVQSDLDDVFYIADLKKLEYISGKSVDSGEFTMSPSGKYLIFSDMSIFFGGDKTSDEFKNVMDIQDLSAISENSKSNLSYFGKDSEQVGNLMLNMLFTGGQIPNLYSKNDYRLSLNEKYAREAITTDKLIEQSGVITAKDINLEFSEVNDPASKIKFSVPKDVIDVKKENETNRDGQSVEKRWSLTNKRNESIIMEIGIAKTNENIDSILKGAKDFDANASKIVLGDKTWVKGEMNKMPTYGTVYKGIGVNCLLSGDAMLSPDGKNMAEKIISSIWIK